MSNVIPRNGLVPGAHGGCRALCAALVAKGLIDESAACLLERLVERSGEVRPVVIAACAVALAATRQRGACVEIDDVVGPIGTVVGSDRAPSSAALVRMLADSRLTASSGSPFVVDNNRLYTRRAFDEETSIASALVALARTMPDDPLDAAVVDALTSPSETDRQRRAVQCGVERHLLVLTGGPGMGKTYTVRALLAALWVRWRHEGRAAPPVMLMAPTGKAAARMREALLAGLDDYVAAVAQGENLWGFADFVRRLEPLTIHRALAWTPVGPYPFRHRPTRPLDAELVVVDEVSMVSSSLMASVVAALRPGGRLVCIGDRHQLASVEAGSVLADLTTGIGGDAVPDEARPLAACVVELNTNYRFSDQSGIGRFASACLRSDADAAAPAAVLLEASDDSLWHSSQGPLPDAHVDSFARGYVPYIERLRRIDDRDATVRESLALLDRFRVLAPHRRGINGVAELNRRIVERLVARDLLAVSVTDPDWIGRPILITQNDHELGLVNGDVGVIVGGMDDPTRRQAAFVRADGQVDYIATTLLPEHETVFAMTVHKAQGSEYDHVALVLPDQASAVVTRELIYTAVTRARRRFDGYGPESTLLAGVVTPTRRTSGLAARLGGLAR